MKLSALLLADFYKLAHRAQYPAGTTKVYSTWTPRASRIKGVDAVVAFGFQAFIKNYLIEFFNENFFMKDRAEVIEEYRRVVKNTLGPDAADAGHIIALHELGYLPLSIKAVPEGTLVPIRTPMLTIENTHPQFYWLTNYIETLASAEMWQPATSATIAHAYKNLLNRYADETGGDKGFVQFQGHDFSMRGMGGLYAAMASGAGHLLSFVGTDTIPAITYAEAHYGADVTKELVGCSVPATEHSVMCAHGQDEFTAYKKLITEVHPTGIVSIVSDTWDFWNVIASVITPLKDTILAREGKVVIRPDSGDPVKILVGDIDATNDLAKKGLIESLWDIFGGTVNEKGYKVLDSHIGAIYGDAITLERCEQICAGLKLKGFASTNVVYGIGSYTYQYNTRDTFGFALKSTLCVINGDEKQIFKNPKTDDGTKKSQKGAVAVVVENGALTYKDGLFLTDTVDGNLLTEVYRDGKLLVEHTFSEIRNRLASQ
jgi:nicotinamide phosphoribosyltransferase